MWAANQADEEIVKLLIEKQADVNVVDKVRLAGLLSLPTGLSYSDESDPPEANKHLPACSFCQPTRLFPLHPKFLCCFSIIIALSCIPVNNQALQLITPLPLPSPLSINFVRKGILPSA